ncbi:hypothetical protein HISP_00035 [Haloarcula hispanica N601]|uniref:Uncharacterized protein n=3 Tax=Haloarcula hispanica TaxID=51589 RepID=V5TPY6_HALHI|nr:MULTISPECIES: hypothetical protein [Haloarcula]AEM55644.1 conserved hypothetical protein [Haloarcula hispanica ATCC 33960]AHB67401.1 hypothetical protein HISP_00035 [Haloarcula hispanica N601]KAA9405694.1 hypothetical protein Har1131_02295 [Haloarcula sp. CBA1131]MCJ0620398.1 hypothetical protein [Haloarcula hispanica]RYJ10802.1 hypothetical protein ELS20_12945 [Haloarcula hispanica]
MIFGLIGLLFNIVTFPGILVNNVVQGVFNQKYNVPAARLAVDKGIDLDEVENTEEAMARVSRVLADGEDPGEGERLEQFTNYHGVKPYRTLFGVILGPFFVMSTLALVLFTGAVGLEIVGVVGDGDGLVWFASIYPGFVVAAHAFPNQGPTSALWDRSRETGSLLRVVGYPLALLSMLFSLLEFLWIDALYALLLYWTVGIPLGVVG